MKNIFCPFKLIHKNDKKFMKNVYQFNVNMYLKFLTIPMRFLIAKTSLMNIYYKMHRKYFF